MTAAWQTMQDMFDKKGVASNTCIMDDEVSAEFTDALTKNKMIYQLVPPHTHQRNLLERSIQTFKNHFKVGLVSVDPNHNGID